MYLTDGRASAYTSNIWCHPFCWLGLGTFLSLASTYYSICLRRGCLNSSRSRICDRIVELLRLFEPTSYVQSSIFNILNLKYLAPSGSYHSNHSTLGDSKRARSNVTSRLDRPLVNNTTNQWKLQSFNVAEILVGLFKTKQKMQGFMGYPRMWEHHWNLPLSYN